MRTLWDLIDPILEKLLPSPAAPTTRAPQGPATVPAAAQSAPAQVESKPPRRAKSRVGPGGPAQAPQPAPAKSRPRPAVRNGPTTAGLDHVRTPKRRKAAAAESRGSAIAPAEPRVRRAGEESADGSMQAKYDAVVRLMLDEHRIRVRKWRSGMSGIAWYVKYRDGTIQRLIEAPRPKGPMSAAIFLHEIGHHAIGFHTYKPRCLEEYHAWRWSLEAMERHGLNITDAVRLRVHRSLWYAVQKAKRRGIKEIPVELAPFLEKPSFARKRTRRRP